MSATAALFASIGMFLLFAVICTIGLSLTISSLKFGAMFIIGFSLVTLIGLLGDITNGHLFLILVGSAGMIGCVAAYGIFRFWPDGSPKKRAIYTALGLTTLWLVVLALAYLGISR